MGVEVDNAARKIELAKGLLDPRFNNVSFLLDQRKLEQANEELDQMTTEDPTCIHMSLSLYRRLFEAYAELNQVEKMERLIVVMEKMYQPRLTDYKLLMQAQIKARRPEQAAKTFAKAHKLHPDLETYNTLLKGLLRCDEKQKAFQVLTHTIKNLEPDKFTYCVLIDAAIKAEAMDHALVFLRHMKEDGVKPEAGVHTILMSWYCKKGDVRTSEEILKMMQSEGEKQYAPTHVTYGVLMTGYLRCGDMEGAENIIERVKKAGQPLNAIHFATLMNANLHSHSYVVEKFTQMEQEGVVPTAPCYTCLIRSIVRGGLLSSIPKIFGHMKSNDILPDVDVFEAAIQAYLDHSEFATAWTVFNNMIDQGYDALPKVFKTFILAYGRFGELGEVKNVLSKMEELKIEPDVAVWNALLEALYMCLDSMTSESSVKLIRHTMSRIQIQDFSPNVHTYNHVFRILGKLRQDDELKYWRSHMEQHNVAPNEETRSLIALAKGGHGPSDPETGRSFYDPVHWTYRTEHKR